MKLSWPVSYDHFNFRGKDFIFFGDVHVEQAPCMDESKTLADFIVDLSQQMVRDKMYMDFFLEVPYGIDIYNVLPDKSQDISYMIKLRETPSIRECYDINRKKCPYYPYVRMHYTDVRSFTDRALIKVSESIRKPAMVSIEDYFSKYNDNLNEHYKLFFADGFVLQYFDLLFNSDNFVGDAITILRKYPRSITQPYLEHFRSLKFKIHPIRKQYLKLEDRELAHLIKNFIITSVKNYISSVIVENLDKENWEITRENFSFFDGKVSLCLGFSMDAYLLLRMFRKFDNASQTAIVYAGVFHCEHYSNFFSKYVQCQRLSPQELSCENFQEERSKQDNYLDNLNQCLENVPLEHLFKVPHFDNITFRNKKISKEFLYGMIMGGTDMSFNLDNKDYIIDKVNVHQVLKIGYDKEKQYLENGPYDRIYFSSNEFLKGYNQKIN